MCLPLVVWGLKYLNSVPHVIIIIYIKDWTLWSVPSQELQLLAPTRLRSSNCSPSLWSVVVWFQRLCLWHSLQVKKPVPSVFSRKLTCPWQYSQQPWVEWRSKPLHRTYTVIKVHLITMAHHDRSICESVIALAEKGGLYASTAGELYGIPMSTAREWLRKYWWDHQVGRRKGTGLWRISSPAPDAALVAEAERNPFFSARDLKAATGFPGQKNMIISRLRAAGLRGRHAAVKELLTDEHKVCWEQCRSQVG